MPEEANKPVQEENGFEGKFFNALLIVLIIVMAFLSVSALLNREPETYSEVYFSPESVPSTAVFGRPLEVSFFIKNMEGASTEYEYTVTAEEKVQAQGKLSLKSGELKQVTETIEFSKPFPEKQKVLVEVSKKEMEKPYSLWFWVKVS